MRPISVPPLYRKTRPPAHKRHLEKGFLILVFVILGLVALYVLALRFPNTYRFPAWIIDGLQQNIP